MASFFKGRKGGYEERDLLDPIQRDVFGRTGQYLSSVVGREMPQYQGEFAADLSPEEQESIARQSRIAAMTEGWAGKFQPGQIDEDVYKYGYEKPLQKYYEEEVEPLTREEYAGAGGYWGSARAGAITKGRRDVFDTLAQQRAKMLESSYGRSLDYARGMTDIGAKTAEMQAVPRIVKQYGLDEKRKEWIRTRPESQKYIDDALRFMDLTTKAYEYKPTQRSGFQHIAGKLGLGTAILADVLAGNEDWTASEEGAEMAKQALLAAMKSGGGGTA